MIYISATEAYGDYPALTARAAIANAISGLTPGDSITIDGVKKLSGEMLSSHHIQVHIHQVTPGGWRLVTRTLPENKILVRRAL